MEENSIPKQPSRDNEPQPQDDGEDNVTGGYRKPIWKTLSRKKEKKPLASDDFATPSPALLRNCVPELFPFDRANKCLGAVTPQFEAGLLVAVLAVRLPTKITLVTLPVATR